VSVLSAKDLYRFFHTETDEVIALRGVSLDVEAGELVVVLGPSGSGKSTLLACLGGLDEPDGGAVVVSGERLTRRSERVKARLRARSFGFVLQSNNLVEHLSIQENVALAMRIAHKADAGRAAATLDRLGIGDRARAYPSELSGGEAVRAAVAAAVATEPAVVLADEPTAEVDTGAEADIARLMLEAARDGAAVVVATHSERLASFADRVVRLVDGAVVQ
jgi:putative ABC transport system ATP-binding protein